MVFLLTYLDISRHYELSLSGVLVGMRTFPRHGGITRVLRTQFSSYNMHESIGHFSTVFLAINRHSLQIDSRRHRRIVTGPSKGPQRLFDTCLLPALQMA